ncbi:MAG: radical SAM protein [Pseudomonadota bacterium]
MKLCTAFHVPERMLFQWHVTDRCNLHCSHCYQDDASHSDLAWNDHLTILEHILSFIRLCRDRNNGRPFRAHVTVTGGEPFVRDDFIPLLERLSRERQYFSLAILTNGTLLTPAVVSSLKKVKPGFVQVSIDGTCETHDRIRGKGSFDRAIAGLKFLVSAGIPAYLSFTAQRKNYRDFPAVARLGRQLGVARVWADRMVPCGRGGETAENLLTPAETREFFELMLQGRKRGWLKRSCVKLHRSLQFTVTGEPPYRCSAGDTLVTILSNGDVCPCRRMPLVVGNIFREPLDRLYGSSELFIGLRDRQRLSKGCEKCFYARSCAGGSRCMACAVYGDPYRADPGCWLTTEG